MPGAWTAIVRFVMPLLAVALLSNCGRREERAAFDAKTQTVPAAETVLASAPLPPSATHVKWGATTVPPSLDAGSSVTVLVTFTNAGDAPWPDKRLGDPKRRDGSHAVRVGHAWSLSADSDSPVRYSPTRGDLPHPLQPGESVTLGVAVIAPDRPGEYTLTFDLVQELDFWFSSRGADPLSIPVKVQAAAAAAPTRTQ